MGKMVFLCKIISLIQYVRVISHIYHMSCSSQQTYSYCIYCIMETMYSMNILWSTSDLQLQLQLSDCNLYIINSHLVDVDFTFQLHCLFPFFVNLFHLCIHPSVHPYIHHFPTLLLLHAHTYSLDRD
jgi:hypothetical protein